MVEKCSFCYQRIDRGLSLGMEPAAIKTNVLKVEQGKEMQALRCIEEREGNK